MKRNEGDCSCCTSRWFCKELCEPAKLYVGQDYVYRHELPMELLPPKALPHVENPTYLTKTEQKIVTLLGQGLTRKEVCQHLEMRRVTLRNNLSRIKKKYVNSYAFNQ